MVAADFKTSSSPTANVDEQLLLRGEYDDAFTSRLLSPLYDRYRCVNLNVELGFNYLCCGVLLGCVSRGLSTSGKCCLCSIPALFAQNKRSSIQLLGFHPSLLV